MITIRHNHEDGTLVYGSRPGDGVYELIGPRTAAHFRYFPSIRQIGIQSSRDRPAKRHQIQAAERALRDAGYEVTVEIDDTFREVAEVKAAQAERLDARYERLTDKAQRAGAEAQSRHAAAEAIGERFAFGQPILVGHHSERRARRDQERMQANDRAAIAAHQTAEQAAAAASVVGQSATYRDRPPVVRRRIDKTEAELRKIRHQLNGTRPANDWRGCYSDDRQPATGSYKESLEAREAWLEHNLAADRELLASYEDAGYVVLDRTKVHKGDVVTSSHWWDKAPMEVTRVNPKTVTVKSPPSDWCPTRKIPYETIQTVQCPHEGTTVKVAAPGKRVAAREAPEVPELATAERAEPIRVDASTNYFPTPPAVVARMVEEAGLAPGMSVLEPSAGLGAIASAVVPFVLDPSSATAPAVDCIELNYQMAGRLRDSGAYRSVRCEDFTEVPAEPVYDRVLMNPPFAGQADIAHVTHALDFVRAGGRLVAVMSGGAEFRSDKKTEGFRKLVAGRGGWIERLPDGSFEQSGTGARTVLVVIPGR